MSARYRFGQFWVRTFHHFGDFLFDSFEITTDLLHGWVSERATHTHTDTHTYKICVWPKTRSAPNDSFCFISHFFATICGRFFVVVFHCDTLILLCACRCLFSFEVFLLIFLYIIWLLRSLCFYLDCMHQFRWLCSVCVSSFFLWPRRIQPMSNMCVWMCAARAWKTFADWMLVFYITHIF